MGNDFNPELSDKYKLTGSNYINWKQQMRSLLLIRGYYDMVTGQESPDKRAEQEKIEPNRKPIAYAIISLNCDVKIASQFDNKCNLNPTILWTCLEEFYLPKTVQNQATYLRRIFSTPLSEGNLAQGIKKIQELTHNLCSLIDDQAVKPSILLDPIVALWECRIEKRTPSLDETIEEVRSAIQRNKENQEKRAFMTKKKEKSDSKPHQKPNYPTCRRGYHNPLTKHFEAECQNLKLGKPTTALLCGINQQDRDSIIIDSGASNSMFNDEKHFISFIPKEEEVSLTNGSSIKYLGSGTICIELSHCFLKINNCLLIPQLEINLLSMNTFIVANYSVTKEISAKSFVVTSKDGKNIINGSFESGNFVIHQNKIQAFKVSLSTPSTTVLHQLSGHPSLEYFKKMHPNKNISSFNCTTCNLSKMTKIPFKGTFPQPNRKLETIHMDLCGPICPESISGKKYFLRIVNGFSHFVWIFFLTNKSECKDYIKNHINRIGRQAISKVANLISDNGSEFKNSDLQNFFKSKGINHLTSAPYTPEQNPFSERGNRTTVNKSRCLLLDSGLDLTYWAETANTAVYLENLTLHKSLSFETPFSKWFDKKPSLKFLHPFGCEAIYLDNFPKSKFSSRGGAGVFLGYGEGHRMFCILDSETGKVKTTHHVKFNDFVFPNKNQANLNQNTESFVVSGSLDIPNNPQTNCSEIPETPYNLELSPNDQKENDENRNANTDTLWQYKGYSWMTEPVDNSKKITSHLDPANILTNSC
ncbi:hypothetical protein O181_054439 [Austropuccinia psidii MF-1]|uniref:Integrase catalytic domain-containing protein n=1 Tax=Austropuccinia psidii MF-1 TaxID=1389203 RepID=A0A9Q3E4K7_9BASI|nr:hypothetical protein [Austropuccinia psidii MF-1]